MLDVNLKVNEKDVPLNEIMSNMLTNLLMAYVKTLKKIPEDITKIQVNIEL